MIRTILTLTAVTALAPPFGINAKAGESSLVINSATALAGPLNINAADASTGTFFAKYAPSRGTPILIYWGHASNISSTSPIWRDKATWACNFASFQHQYYPIPGYPLMDILHWQQNHGCDENYAQLDPSTDKIDCSDANLQLKINAHAAHDARQICDCIHKQGLIRGRGPIGGGNYGGAFSHHELFTDGRWQDNTAHFTFTALFRHPDDAPTVPRTQYLPTSAGVYRADSPTTLFKVDPQGALIGGSFQTASGRTAIEANTIGARPGNYHHLFCEYGIAAAKRYVVALRAAVKDLCDSYLPPGETDPIELCYPAYVLLDSEDMSTRVAMHSNGYINDPAHGGEPPSPGGPGYYLLGCLYHVMGDFGAPNNTWTMPIYYSGSNFDIPESYQSTIYADTVLRNLYYKYAPTMGDSREANSDVNLRFNKIIYQAADYCLFKAMIEPWKEEFPQAGFSNYEFVVVPDPLHPYQRPSSSGVASIQEFIRQDYQAPSCYGMCGASDPYVTSIRNAVGQEALDAAVEDWNNESHRLIVDQILKNIHPTMPTDAYIYGVYLPEQLRSKVADPPGIRDRDVDPRPTDDNQWGGDKSFFKRLVKTLWKRGIYKYVVYSGDIDLTFEAWKEVQAEIRAGDLET
ncbi:MAG: hypothetical protein KF691_03105 [Phycisphaeraceae bacterium]|nr:hypothetical protein [Phycisphaeraceae bacterium]